MAIAPDTTGSVQVAAATSASATVDITAAATGAIVFAYVCVNNSIAVTTFTGWTNVLASVTNVGSSDFEVWYRVKVAGDTTFTCSIASATRWQVVWASYTGFNVSTPFEGNLDQKVTSGGGSFSTPSSTPTLADRWAIAFFGGTDGSTATSAAWTVDAALTSRLQLMEVHSGANQVVALIADSNAAVTAAAHTYTSSVVMSPSGTASNGGAGVIFLIPAAGSTNITLTGVVSTVATAAPAGTETQTVVVPPIFVDTTIKRGATF